MSVARTGPPDVDRGASFSFLTCSRISPVLLRTMMVCTPVFVS